MGSVEKWSRLMIDNVVMSKRYTGPVKLYDDRRHMQELVLDDISLLVLGTVA